MESKETPTLAYWTNGKTSFGRVHVHQGNILKERKKKRVEKWIKQSYTIFILQEKLKHNTTMVCSGGDSLRILHEKTRLKWFRLYTYWRTWCLRLQSNCDRWGIGRRWTALPERRSSNPPRTNFRCSNRPNMKKKNKISFNIIIKIDSSRPSNKKKGTGLLYVKPIIKRLYIYINFLSFLRWEFPSSSFVTSTEKKGGYNPSSMFYLYFAGDIRIGLYGRACMCARAANNEWGRSGLARSFNDPL